MIGLVPFPSPVPTQAQRQRELFSRDRARAVSERKKRLLTGEAWELRADAISKLPYWYNRDTGEITMTALDASNLSIPVVLGFPKIRGHTDFCRSWTIFSKYFSALSFVFGVIIS